MKIVVVIMAGGAGTRFWPLSTEQRPKQFLALVGERSLLQMSFDRVGGLVPPEQVLVLTNRSYEELVADQLPELPRANIVGEPARRDTAAAVALASLLVRQRFGESTTMVLLTADHVISPSEKFQAALLEAVEGCQHGGLYTLGIRPTYPATGFGYLQMGSPLSRGRLPHFRVERFKEKPSREVAEVFVESGNYYWNAGMFIWRCDQILAEFAHHLPAHLSTLEPVIPAGGRFDPHDLEVAFEKLERISVDYAILERASQVQAVIPDIAWDDVGGWQAVAQYLPQDNAGNRLHGAVRAEKATGNVVFSEQPEDQILLLGVENLVVVRSGTRTLVAHRDQLDSLKLAVDNLALVKA